MPVPNPCPGNPAYRPDYYLTISHSLVHICSLYFPIPLSSPPPPFPPPFPLLPPSFSPPLQPTLPSLISLSSPSSHLQLLEMMVSLIKCPLIHQDFHHKYPIVFDQELDNAKLIFDQQVALAQTPSGPVINKNMPYVAGVLQMLMLNHGWVNELSLSVASSLLLPSNLVVICFAGIWMVLR